MQTYIGECANRSAQCKSELKQQREISLLLLPSTAFPLGRNLQGRKTPGSEFALPCGEGGGEAFLQA